MSRMFRRRPATNLVSGLVAIAMGVGFGVLAAINGEPWTTVLAANGLTIFGVIWIAVMTTRS